MNNILKKIAEYAEERVASAKKSRPLSDIKSEALQMPVLDFSFEKAISRKEPAFICECKKASPSKGIIAQDFPYLDIARQYEEAGADCISVLTEPKWFLGSNEYLKEIAANVSIPCIKKDFVVDEYMLFEARLLGASCVLLICAITSEEKLKEYIGICDMLGLSALVEAHNEQEIVMAQNANARMIGVNNRNLKDFSVDFSNSLNLRGLVSDDVLFVAESGVKDPEDVRILAQNGVNAVLIGEALMRADDKKAFLEAMRQACCI